MISLELCEISLFFREIKTTTAKNPTNVLWVTIIFIIFEAVFVNWFFKLQKLKELLRQFCIDNEQNINNIISGKLNTYVLPLLGEMESNLMRKMSRMRVLEEKNISYLMKT